jgi:hypothetical protein
MITKGQQAEIEGETVDGFKGLCALIKVFAGRNPLDHSYIDSAHVVVSSRI